jgi:hypothetical protein
MAILSIACVFLVLASVRPAGAGSILWAGNPTTGMNEIGHMQHWLGTTVANRWPADSMVILTHGNSFGQMQVPLPGFPLFQSNNPAHVDAVVDMINQHVVSGRGGTPFASCWLIGCNLAKAPAGMSPWGAVLAQRFPETPFFSFNNLVKVLPAELGGPRGVNLLPMTFDASAADATALLVARAPGIQVHQFDSTTGALRPIANRPGEPGLRPLTGAHADVAAAGVPGLRGPRLVGTGQNFPGTDIPIPENVLVRFLTGAQESQFDLLTAHGGHLGARPVLVGGGRPTVVTANSMAEVEALATQVGALAARNNVARPLPIRPVVQRPVRNNRVILGK